MFNLLDVRLLAKIEHQVLELLHWCVPMGTDNPEVYQTYTNAIFDTASHDLGRQVPAPQVLLHFEKPANLPPAAYAAAAIQRHARGANTSPPQA